jgi:hypothetical protein
MKSSAAAGSLVRRWHFRARSDPPGSRAGAISVEGRLRSSGRDGSLPGVIFARVFLLLAAMTFAACQSCPMWSGRYTRFEVTNYRGELIASWVAEGSFRSFGDGFLITAVQRTSALPYAQTSRYPDGWKTWVSGPHIRYGRCAKPHWMEENEQRGFFRSTDASPN